MPLTRFQGLEGFPVSSQRDLAFLDVERVGQVTVVRFTRSYLSQKGAVLNLGPELFSRLRKEDPPWLVLDFSGVTHLTSPIIGQLALLHKKAEPLGGRLALCAFPREALEVLRLSRLDEVFNLYRNEEEALESFD
jgi:anti-sigma B factor antagonist